MIRRFRKTLCNVFYTTENYYELAFSEDLQGPTRRKIESDRSWSECNFWCGSFQRQRWTERRLPKREHPRYGNMGSAAHRRSFIAAVSYSAIRYKSSWCSRPSLCTAVLIPDLAITCHRNPQRKHRTAHQ